MKKSLLVLACLMTLAAVGCDDSPSTPSTVGPYTMSFFVTSQRSTTGNLGGLSGADATCQRLAAAVGAGDKTWRAYLSVEHDPSNNNLSTYARNRIGSGPWFNAKNVVIAHSIAELHSRRGDAALFVDEKGQPINGQWTGSPTPNEHDILTGSNADGTLMMGFTCNDWTSNSASVQAQVGHSDGFGPNQDQSGTLASWNSAHANQNCANTAPRGGAGRIYCFAR